ncbi:hypothetical protein E3O53_12510 [Cryobacterium sp. TMT2-18-3]|uniref:hypothetical protein n=1 Tax=unclassified Cryobacterium TaxID=2649013 RepID=UPI00106C8CF4|nr:MULTISPECIES: hypothetical protein [unclassified Cryobacterium]TFC28299.1 hypothetical protein E3O22_08575 [Cryobacterium sp. TMT2-18-2]TFC62370.1 hypothetical protein E3O53_12510 [Cryobacterium sp. TMT2-18-3]
MSLEIVKLVPGVDSNGVYEVALKDSTILTVALASRLPMLLQRFPVAGAERLWLDRTPLEFDSLPEFVVGEPVILNDARGTFRSPPIAWIVRLDDDEKPGVDDVDPPGS